MIHKEERVFNIFVQHQYLVLTYTYKKTHYNKLQEIEEGQDAV